MDVRLISADGVSRHRPDELDALLLGPGLVWVDVAYWDAEVAAFLGARLGLDRATLQLATVRNPVPTFRTGDGRTAFVLHAPEPGDSGHVHTVELDQVVGPDWVLTVHGPMNPSVPLAAAYVETDAVARLLTAGELHPTRGAELSAALAAELVERQREYLVGLTTQVWRLEQQVSAGEMTRDPERALEELFSVRHSLLALHMMARTSAQLYGQLARAAVFGPDAVAPLDDLEDQFRRLAAAADGERAYLQGVIEFYQTRTDTTMTIAAERLAVIAAVTLPITALSSVLGMNVIVSTHTLVGPLIVILVVTTVMSGVLLEWCRRKGWW